MVQQVLRLSRCGAGLPSFRIPKTLSRHQCLPMPWKPPRWTLFCPRNRLDRSWSSLRIWQCPIGLSQFRLETDLCALQVRPTLVRNAEVFEVPLQDSARVLDPTIGTAHERTGTD